MLDETGQLTHIRVTWVYDEYYSLLITEDLGIDRDYDGLLTQAEKNLLTGFDMNWIEGYNGDLDATLNGEALSLSGPTEPTATLEAGRIVTTHLRSVSNTPSLTGGSLSLQPYDETYYTAYEVTMPVTLSPQAACLIERIEPNIDSALAEMRDMLLRIEPDADLEENDFPLIGAKFATDIRVSCPAS